MQPKHRIVYVVGQLGGGGAERQLTYLLSTMDRDRYSPAVAVWHYDPSAHHAAKLQAMGVPIFPMPRAGSSAAGRIRCLRRLVGELRPEVLHSYSFHTNFPAWYASVGRRTVPIGSMRNEYQAERREAGLVGGALCSRWPEWVIVNSDHARRAAVAARGWSRPRRVEFVPNGIDLARYPVRPIPSAEPFEILGIGRFYPQKRWDDMLRALAQFSEQTHCSWRFRFCGTGPLEQELRELSAALGVADRVEFLGFRADTAALIASSHVVTLSSGFEGTPNVIMEALACGRPVVATDAGDVSRLVDDGVQGFVVPIGDTQSIACRLATLQACPELAAKMGRAARARAEEMDLQSLLARTFGVYAKAGWTERKRIDE